MTYKDTQFNRIDILVNDVKEFKGRINRGQKWAKTKLDEAEKELEWIIKKLKYN